MCLYLARPPTERPRDRTISSLETAGHAHARSYRRRLGRDESDAGRDGAAARSATIDVSLRHGLRHSAMTRKIG